MAVPNRSTSIPRFVVLLIFILASLSANASIYYATVSPKASTTPLGTGSSITVTWTIQGVNSFVSSQNGWFWCEDAALNYYYLGLSPGSLYRKITGTGSTVSVTEAVLVPSDVIYRAYQKGITSIYFTRDFSDLNGPSVDATIESVKIIISSSSTSGFSITGMSLAFDDDSVVRVVKQKEQVTAKATVSFAGTGLLNGVWEIADPVGSSAEPIYRPIGVVNQYLMGRDKQILRSPVLPTNLSGLYLLRLRLTAPAPGFEKPILRYFVGGDSTKPGAIPILPIESVQPGIREILTPQTKFSWEAIRDVKVYKIEFYGRQMSDIDKLPDIGERTAVTAEYKLPKDSHPISGMLVRGNNNQTLLSLAARAHLQPGRVYLWRVLALNKSGEVIGMSQLRELRTP